MQSRPYPVPLDTHCTFRCNAERLRRWQAYADERGDLSHVIRSVMDNLSGINEEPVLDWLTEEEVKVHHRWLKLDWAKRVQHRLGRSHGGATLLAVGLVGLGYALGEVGEGWLW